MDPGSKLGPYEILEQLGAGGMGEVYLAEDTRLQRKVAVKVLPPEFASDPERLARFEQEARAAAALNHPHIAIVHDVGHETDDAGQATHFMVQEFLDGQDLHALLQNGPLPRPRALALGAEIAEALAAAHAAGIVHRDLKPKNIFVSPNGHAKVLDFGLAKLIGPTAESSGADATESPTMMGTMAGVVMGSAGYMAPEQADGGVVDHRVDLFACGCVLYEMLVGERAFEGETLIDTLHAITRNEPDALAESDARIDPAVGWLLEKCLVKDPAGRYQGAGDLAIDLRRLAAAPATGPPGAVVSETAKPEPSWLPWIAAIGTLVLGLFAGASFLGTNDSGTAIRLSIPTQLQGNPDSSYMTISPDGTTVAYRLDAAASSLVLRRLDSFELTPVLGSEGALGPFFSPDGRKLAFFSSGSLWAVDVAGGTPRQICSVAQNNSTGVWGDDGFIYFVQWATGDGVYRVSEEGGEISEVMSIEDADVNPGRPRLLPDGRGVVVQLGQNSRVYFFDGTTSISIDRPQVTYLEQGRALFVEAGQLFVADYDDSTYRIEGEPRLLATDVVDYQLSAAGTIAYRYSEGASSYGQLRPMVRYSRDGTRALIGTVGDGFSRPDISPDGSLIGTNGLNLAGLFIWDVARGTQRSLFEVGSYFQWGPDGNTVYFQGRDNDDFYIDRLSLDDTVAHERILVNPISTWPTDVATDGSALLYYEIHPETERDIWVLPLDGRHEPEPFLVTPASERSAVFSPNGRWIAYMSDTSGREEVYVRPRAAGDGREVIVTVDGGREPRWSPDGSEIYFRLEDDLWAVPVTTDTMFAVGRPQLLFTGSFDYEEGGRNQQYDVFPDGSFLMIERLDLPQEIRIVLNWLDEVEALER